MRKIGQRRHQARGYETTREAAMVASRRVAWLMRNANRHIAQAICGRLG